MGQGHARLRGAHERLEAFEDFGEQAIHSCGRRVDDERLARCLRIQKEAIDHETGQEIALGENEPVALVSDSSDDTGAVSASEVRGEEMGIDRRVLVETQRAKRDHRIRVAVTKCQKRARDVAKLDELAGLDTFRALREFARKHPRVPETELFLGALLEEPDPF